MRAVLFATREAPELYPLTKSTPVALLSIAGKSLLMHAVESLAMAGVREVIIVTALHGRAIQKTLGDGARFGARFEYCPAGQKEPSESIIKKLLPRLRSEYLIIRGDILRAPVVGEFLQHARTIHAPVIAALFGTAPGGLALVRQSDPRAIGFVDRLPDLAGSDAVVSTVNFPKAKLSPLDSLAAFHRANLDAAAGRFGALVIPGREWAPGVLVGRDVRLPRLVVKGRDIFIGSGTRIANNARVLSEVVVSGSVLIDRGASLRAAVVLPHTYIGQRVNIRNAIVAGNTLIDVNNEAVLQVGDSSLLAHLGRFGDESRYLN